MERPTCEACAYWERAPMVRDLGDCRRRAPAPTASEESEGLAAWWPTVADDDWCGEHHLFPLYLEELERARRV